MGTSTHLYNILYFGRIKEDVKYGGRKKRIFSEHGIKKHRILLYYVIDKGKVYSQFYIVYT